MTGGEEVVYHAQAIHASHRVRLDR